MAQIENVLRRNQTNFKNSISTLMIINYILKIEL